MKSTAKNNFFVLIVLLVCFVGQSVATTISCNNMADLMSSLQPMLMDNNSMEDCHEKTKSKNLSAYPTPDTDHNCEEKCSCCAHFFTSTSLFSPSFSVQKSVEASIPFLPENIYTLNINAVFRPPIA